MKAPTKEEEWLRVSKGFETMWNFPCCLGAIDGKHVQILAPANSGSSYYCYKQFFSIILMAVCDAQCRFTLIDLGSNGRLGDRGVWSNSPIREGIENGTLNLPGVKTLSNGKQVPHVFVGDEAFPLKNYLLRPYSRASLNLSTRIFNYRLSRARRVIENAFGILTKVWRIYGKPIAVDVKHVTKIVLATCVSHNLLRYSLLIIWKEKIL